MELRAQPSVDAEELLVHNSSQGQRAERLHAGLVDGLGIFMPALQLEGEVIRKVAALVVPAQQPEGLGVVYLEGPEVQDALDAEVSPVNVVAEEEVPRLGGVATDLEELHQIVVLAVDVAADGDGRVHLEEVGLRAEQLGTRLDDP